MDLTLTATVAEMLESRFGERFDVPPEVAANPDIGRIAGRRSIRAFLDRPVSEALLQVLLGCAFSAPTKSDLQQASVVRVADPSLREAFGDMIRRLAWIRTAPVFLVFCADGRRTRRISEMRGCAFANEHLDAFFNATVDGALVMMNFIRAAEAAGLGACAVSVIRNYPDRVRDLLALPPWVVPIAGLAVGWPAEQGRLSPRLPLAVTVHTDRYDDADLEADVDRYDRRRDAIQPIPPSKRRDAGEGFYGWSADKAQQEARPERPDFGAFVRGQGFGL